jgi:short subunit dehydrogenase-like uncharacterized protein
MTGRALLYGAYGYTGCEVAQGLAGVDLVLGGRNAIELRVLAERLGLEWRAFPLTEPDRLDAALADIEVVLHAAGPFTLTAQPMLDACLRTNTHYLDLAGEWPVFLDAMAHDDAARGAGVMVMPGVGLTIAATDGLLALAKEKWPETVRLRLGVSRAQVITGGSVASAARILSPEVLIRRSGELVAEPAGKLVHAFDFGEGLREATALTWPDVVTGEFTTGVSDIEVYSELGWPGRASYRALSVAMELTGAAPWRRAGQAMASAWPDAPSDAARRDAGFMMVVEALDAWRRPRWLRMRTRDGYTASVLTASAAVRRVLAGGCLAGFQTPARAFGPSFVVETGAAVLVTPVEGALV